jgi:lysophospholipase L1-like esterase
MTLRLLPRRGSVARRRLVAGTALALALTALFVDPHASHPSAHAAGRAATSGAPAEPSRTVSVVGRRHRVTSDASGPKTVTLVTDSVTLGAASALRAALPGRQVQVLGKPALMIDQVVPRYLPPGRRVGSVVVVGLGYNSLWQPHRTRFDVWAAQFDREASSLVAALRSRGAEKIVWVTLREPTARVVSASDEYQYSHYAWYFPYVNERLRALARRGPDIALADWAAVSNRTDLTYDLIHLDPKGARVMARVIVGAINA